MSFKKDIDDFDKEFEKNINGFVQEITRDITYEIIDRSPVKTGNFRGNWQHATNSTPTGLTGQFSPVATTAKSRVNQSLKTIKAGNVENVVNNVDYGNLLEFLGWSNQAPEGMVRVTFSHIEQTIRKVLFKITGGLD